MKAKLKNAFTLTEILVALTIIGIIASLTLPQLVANVQNNKNAVALGRSVEAIETGCQMLIRDASERTNSNFYGYSVIKKNDIGLSGTTLIVNEGKLFSYAANYFNAEPLSASKKTAYTTNGVVRNITGSSASPTLANIAKEYAVNTKTGAYYASYYVEESSNDDPIMDYIYIDVNGINAPNKYGQDVFLFGLTDSCHMIPAGTQRMKTLSNIPLESNGCGNNITNGLSCTSRVVREGYKNSYK